MYRYTGVFRTPSGLSKMYTESTVFTRIPTRENLRDYYSSSHTIYNDDIWKAKVQSDSFVRARKEVLCESAIWTYNYRYFLNFTHRLY